MSIENTRATLLGLPAELRLRIYEYVCHLEIDCTILNNIEHYMSRGIKARLILNQEANLRSNIPWINLSSTCKIIAAELKFFMLEASFLNSQINRIYSLDLEVYNAQTQDAVRKAIWRQIPCPPQHAQILVMNIATSSGFGPWTDGGPASLARAVYQMLNHTCHNGPRMIRRHELKSHMQVKDLIINIDIGGTIRPPRSACNTDPEYNYSQFVKAFQQISKAGLLFGYVGSIKVRRVDAVGGEDSM